VSDARTSGAHGAPAWRRTHTCGELRKSHVGSRTVLNGWVHARRDHGGIYFLDLRDRYGVTQVVISEKIAAGLTVGPEYVLAVHGLVSAREGSQINRERPTGEIEVIAESVEVLSSSPTPPIDVTGATDTALETRLKYRYFDLRRPAMQKNLAHRSKFINAMRRAFEREGFLEIETPILTKATPEGARDYLVPSRVHPGEFYALPQSPQIFKQILMVAGLDKYFQVARCFRDEDLRADRQPEFTQLDMEMSFVEEEDVFATWERVLQSVFREVMSVELAMPFDRMTWDQAMDRYGVDKPDLRFGLELKALSAAWIANSRIPFFKSAIQDGGCVKCIVVPCRFEEQMSRKSLTELETVAKSLGAGGLAWWRANANSAGAGPLSRFLDALGESSGLMREVGAEDADIVLCVAGRSPMVRRVLGELRNQLARKLGLIGKDAAWRFTWVTQFPMFEYDAEAGRWFSAHHPFTAPVDWTLGGPDPKLENLPSRAYDLVLNGWELGSGSVRIHRADVQQRVFEILGISREEQQRKFGFLLEALACGAPPHAGFALGLDRTTALTLGLDNIRDMIAFPKTASATDLMCGAPSLVDDAQLREVHVKIDVPPPRADAAPPA
jgi:aspartyl-tRNA synthetase